MLFKQLDSGNKGYINPDKLMDKIDELASETNDEASLRTFATACKRQGVNLK